MRIISCIAALVVVVSLTACDDDAETTRLAICSAKWDNQQAVNQALHCGQRRPSEDLLPAEFRSWFK